MRTSTTLPAEVVCSWLLKISEIFYSGNFNLNKVKQCQEIRALNLVGTGRTAFPRGPRGIERAGRPSPGSKGPSRCPQPASGPRVSGREPVWLQGVTPADAQLVGGPGVSPTLSGQMVCVRQGPPVCICARRRPPPSREPTLGCCRQEPEAGLAPAHCPVRSQQVLVVGLGRGVCAAQLGHA